MPSNINVGLRGNLRWEFAPQVLSQGARRHNEMLYNNTKQVLGDLTKDIEKWMKANAPWKDRTGKARATLSATLVTNDYPTPLIGVITLSHGVPYGLWLEVAHGGRYSILGPTIDYWGGRIMRLVSNMMKSRKGMGNTVVVAHRTLVAGDRFY